MALPSSEGATGAGVLGLRGCGGECSLLGGCDTLISEAAEGMQ